MLKDPTLRAIVKYKDHPSVLAVQNKRKNRIKLDFEEMDLASIEKEIHILKINKASPKFGYSDQYYKGKCWYFCRIFMEKHKQLN